MNDSRPLFWKAVKQLEKGELERSAELFDKLLLENPLYSMQYYALAGIVAWMRRDVPTAIDLWVTGMGSGYGDAAGGIHLPLLLYFAAVREPGSFPLSEAKKLLKKILAAPRGSNWPGPYGAYLLGQIKEASILREISRESWSNVEEDMVVDMACIEFYLGIKKLEAGDEAAYYEQMGKCASCREGHLVQEYYLARYESGQFPKTAAQKRKKASKPSRTAKPPKPPKASQSEWPQSKFYVNLTLYGVEQKPVVAWLKADARRVIVSPTANGFTVIYDEACDTQEDEPRHDLASRLSKELACPVLVALVHDDDFLLYELFQSGRKVDSYHSSPDYFKFTPADEWSKSRKPVAPKGGKPEKLLKAFASSASIQDVEQVLRGDYAFATERHQALAKVLSLPDFSVGTGFDGVNSFDPLPTGFVRTSGRRR